MNNPYITPALFSFLRELKKNNNREWFAENKARYIETVRSPLLEMIENFAPLLYGLSPHYVAVSKANGGSLFRIYRDVRFSHNKSPYKTHAGIQFRHEAGKNAHAPGFYLHLEPDSVFAALGVWHPESIRLRQIRTFIADDPDEWQATTEDAGFSSRFTLEGDRLKRPPRGFDPDHPQMEDLKRKDFIAVCRMKEEEACAPDFMPHLAEIWGSGVPFMRFLTEAMELPF